MEEFAVDVESPPADSDECWSYFKDLLTFSKKNLVSRTWTDDFFLVFLAMISAPPPILPKAMNVEVTLKIHSLFQTKKFGVRYLLN